MESDVENTGIINSVIYDRIKKGYIVNAEVFGNGIDMWIRSQGNAIKVLQ